MTMEKSKLSARKKIKILNYVSFSLVILITISISLFSNYYINNINSVEKSVEIQWRDEARDKAKYLAQQLELAIAKGEVNYWDDAQLHEWAEQQLLPMKVGGEMSNIILVNIGYSIRNWDELNWVSVQDELDLSLPVDCTSVISNHFKDLDFTGKSNSYVKDYIDSYVAEFAETYDIDSGSIITAIQKVLFVKNKILLDTDPGSVISNQLLNNRFIEDYLYTDKELFEHNLEKILSGQESIYHDNTIMNTTDGVKWLEWSVVPPNKLGWELEPPHKQGIENVGYKKIAIIVELDEGAIEKPYSSIFDSTAIIHKISCVVVSVLVCIVILTVFVSFYKLIKSEE